MIEIRHRSCSGRLDDVSMWEFDPSRRVVELVLRQGSARALELTIPVCVIDRPRLAAFAISRLDGCSWRILPIRFIWEGERLVYFEVAVHPAIGGRVQLVLTHAPAIVDAEFEALGL